MKLTAYIIAGLDFCITKCANVDSDKIIDIAEKGDEKYTIPIHEFSKQALLGEYSHYDSKSSIALNLFDLRYPDPREHFLSSIIVAYLLSDSRGKSSEGFFNTSDLISEVQSYCYVPDQIEHALRRLTNKKLIETTERITFQEGLEGLAGDMPLAFRATTVGSYHVLRWSGSFAYLDAMQFDMPVLDDEIRNSMLHKLGSFDIRDRFHRTTAFDKYLAKAWDMLERKPVYYDWPTIRRQGNHSFTSVQRAVHAISAR